MPDLSALPDGTRVFVDTNIFHFHFQARSVSCSQFITRIVRGEIEAYVNTQVLSDLLHKLMLFEAFSKNRIRNNNDVRELKNFLRANRGKAMPLTDYETQFENILAIGLRVLPITEKLLVDTKSERQSYCLMTGDSLHLGTMNRCRAKRRKAPLQDIVTYDNDFAFIPEVTVWQPTDVIW